MNRSLNRCKETKNDIFYTPSDLVDDCVKLIKIAKSDTLLDPFYGDGAFYSKYPETNKKDWCEIEKGVDFFKYNKKVDWVISNPPFSKLTKVLNHCSEICKMFWFDHFMFSFATQEIKCFTREGILHN